LYSIKSVMFFDKNKLQILKKLNLGKKQFKHSFVF
jgi:hypothetical protein